MMQLLEKWYGVAFGGSMAEFRHKLLMLMGVSALVALLSLYTGVTTDFRLTNHVRAICGGKWAVFPGVVTLFISFLCVAVITM